ncbi:hypothetical protein [Tateyamaria sp. ANG-S1]|uniref:hypothetical protein n=1 Tax=Tateyamaria sp. ANG-S1 TaxID=1577905 RepID=UPI0005833C73|nr:hypothetical protein [Tateyamaria sp. ANG-S1]KIC51047.1 hypothetical protein RA29_03980 [Tateyamaria sp. ANG-S1]
MSPDVSSSLPVSGTFILAALGFAAFSLLAAGPTIAKREIANSDWMTVCKSELRADIEATRRPRQAVPEVPDLGNMLCTFYPELNQLCHMIPDVNAPAREAERRARAAEEARIRRAVAETENACSCATSVYVEKERMSLALYAASGRLTTPEPVENRNSALFRALRNPACGMEG